MSRWTLGPEHRDHGADVAYGPPPRPYKAGQTQTRAKPSAYHCSQCGAEKPSGRALCPCGAFRKHGRQP